jgi:glycosyltransferase involved in cell wall biosynthesis
MDTKVQNNTLIIIPVFNEEYNIDAVLESLRLKASAADIVVINDGSSDTTSDSVVSKGIMILNHAFNIGIGASFQTGCIFALKNGYEYIVRMDGDGQHDPVFIKDILDPVKQGKFDIVIGSRFLRNSEFESSLMRVIGIRIIAFFLYYLTGKKVTDPTSGFCAMNRKAFSFFAVHCPEDYPEPEILIHHRNFCITEVPISLSTRKYGYSSITPLKSMYYMYKVLFSIFVSIFKRRR